MLTTGCPVASAGRYAPPGPRPIRPARSAHWVMRRRTFAGLVKLLERAEFLDLFRADWINPSWPGLTGWTDFPVSLEPHQAPVNAETRIRVSTTAHHASKGWMR